jgi:hypothetical protein
MVTPRNIIPGIRIESTVETYYTVPSNTRCILKKVTITNDDLGAAYTVDIWIVPPAGAPIAGNKIAQDLAIGPTETREVFFLENAVMEAGSTLQMQASTGNKMTLFASGVEIV